MHNKKSMSATGNPDKLRPDDRGSPGLCARWWPILLALVAGGRVFFGAAALPFFSNVDEESHYDLVRKYARGHVPGAGSETFDADVARQICLFGSPEFLTPTGQFAEGP